MLGSASGDGDDVGVFLTGRLIKFIGKHSVFVEGSTRKGSE